MVTHILVDIGSAITDLVEPSKYSILLSKIITHILSLSVAAQPINLQRYIKQL